MKKLFPVVLGSLFLASFSVNAKVIYLKNFTQTYPMAGKISSCILCHQTSFGGPLNAYGTDLKASNKDFKSIENLDSDGDGVDNITEIVNNTFPGNSSSVGNSIINELSEEEIEEIVNYYYNR